MKKLLIILIATISINAIAQDYIITAIGEQKALTINKITNDTSTIRSNIKVVITTAKNKVDLFIGDTIITAKITDMGTFKHKQPLANDSIDVIFVEAETNSDSVIELINCEIFLSPKPVLRIEAFAHIFLLECSFHSKKD